MSSRLFEGLTAAEALLRSEQLLSALRGVIWEADPVTGDFVFVSPHAEHVLGYPAAQWLLHGFWAAHLHHGDRDAAMAARRAAIAAGRDHELDYRMIAADGSVTWFHDVTSIAADASGATRVRGLMVDVSEQKRTDAELRCLAREDLTEQHMAERARVEHVRFLEGLDLVNVAIQGATDVDGLMDGVSGALMTVFDCDRAWLARRTSLDPPQWQFVAERCHADCPGFGRGLLFGMEMEESFRLAAGGSGPQRYPVTTALPPARVCEQCAIRSQMCVAISPASGPPFLVGLQHCRQHHEWTPAEERLLQEIGRRLADAFAVVLTREAQRVSEQRLAEAQRITHLGYWDIDYTAGHFTVSEETLRILAAPVTGTTFSLDQSRAVWRESTHPDDRARVQAATEEALAGRQPYDIEYRVVRPDGAVRSVRSLGHVTRDEAGQPLRWFGTIQDVTPLREAEQALRDIHERYRLIVDHTTDVVMLHGVGGELLDVNRQACESLGYSREELIGRTVEAFDPAFSPEVGVALVEALSTGDVVQFETVHRRKDGTTFPVETRSRGFWQEGARIAVSSSRDISERRRAEEAARQSHSLMRAIVEGTSDAIYVKDRDGRYLMVNGAFADLRGTTVDGLLGTLDPGAQDLGGLGPEDRAVLTTGEPRMFEQTLEIDGATRTFHSATFPYWKDGDAPGGLIGVWRETTELKHLEDALRESQKMEAIGRLAGGVAHNFNNLLTVILGYAEVISYGLDDQPEHRESIEQIMTAAERASAVTRQLLSFSRKQALAPRLVHLPTALGELHALLRPLIPADIEMTVHTAVDLGAVLMDAAQFEQAMTNLVVNASDAMPRGGRLRIEAIDLVITLHSPVHPALVKPGRYVELRVWDSGHGMDEATRARIFEPFFTTKPFGQGAGLGLPTVYGFVTQTGGHIDVTSTPGGGTLFRLLLPCSAAAAPATLLSRPAPAETNGTETILLVEDEDAVRAVAKLALEARGYRVIEARDGQHALDVARGHAGRIDLLLTDLVMPRLNGRDLADVLTGEMPHLQVLFMSGYPDKVVSDDTPADPRFGFLRKPFQPSTMVRRVRGVLDRRDS